MGLSCVRGCIDIHHVGPLLSPETLHDALLNVHSPEDVLILQVSLEASLLHEMLSRQPLHLQASVLQLP